MKLINGIFAVALTIILCSCLSNKQVLIIEAENMTLSQGYMVEDVEWIRGTKGIRIYPFYPEAKPGYAKYIFNGKDGFYDIKIYFFDENDGKCTYNFYLNDKKIDSWIPDKDLGGKHPGIYTYQLRLITGLNLKKKDEIKLEGIADVKDESLAELARLDKIEIVKSKSKSFSSMTIDPPNKK